jgi:hypothetical protein
VHIQTLSSWASKNAVAGTCVQVLIDDEIGDHSSCSIKSRNNQILYNTNGHHNARFSLYKIEKTKNCHKMSLPQKKQLNTRYPLYKMGSQPL